MSYNNTTYTYTDNQPHILFIIFIHAIIYIIITLAIKDFNKIGHKLYPTTSYFGDISTKHESSDNESSDNESSDNESSNHESTDNESSNHESTDNESCNHESSNHDSSNHESSDHETIKCKGLII